MQNKVGAPATDHKFPAYNFLYRCRSNVLLKKYFQVIPIILGILPTFVDARLSMTDQVLSTIDEIWGNTNTIIFPPIRVDTNVAKANRYHKTIFEYAPQSRAAEDYKQVAGVLLDFIEKQENKSGGELLAQEEKTG